MRDFTIRGVAVVIRHPDEPLFVGVARRFATDDWGLPGGKVEDGESLVDAAVREVLEETGLTVTLRPHPTYIGAANRRNCAAFMAESFSGELRGSAEGDVAWVTKDQLLSGTFGAYHARLFGVLDNDPSQERPEHVIPRRHQTPA